MRTIPCPKCKRKLKQSGEITGVGGEPCPVFQCDHCTVWVNMFGEETEVALTFALDATGKPFDPATPDGSLPI